MGSIWSLKDHVEASAAAAQRRRKLRPDDWLSPKTFRQRIVEFLETFQPKLVVGVPRG